MGVIIFAGMNAGMIAGTVLLFKNEQKYRPRILKKCNIDIIA